MNAPITLANLWPVDEQFAKISSDITLVNAQLAIADITVYFVR